MSLYSKNNKFFLFPDLKGVVCIIHTIQYIVYPQGDDIETVTKMFKTSKDWKGRFVYYHQHETVKYDYLPCYGCLKIVLNPSKLLEKQVITSADLYPFLQKYEENFYSIFTYSNPYCCLSRVDYKIDIVTPYKNLLVKLYKKSPINSHFLKQRNKWDTSVYFNGISKVVSIYDKEAEHKKKHPKVPNPYKNLLRIETQVKRRKIYYNLRNKNWGLVDDIGNYFKENMRDYYINESLKGILYQGDFYNSYHSQKVLERVYSSSMVSKLLDLQKLISIHGVTMAQKMYRFADSTFASHLNRLQVAGVNPVPIPKNEGIIHLVNPLNLTTKDILSVSHWEGLLNQKYKIEG